MSLSPSLNVLVSCETQWNMHENLSTSKIKRLFFIWFNSISKDNTSLNLSQFSTILKRIFSESTTTLSQTKVSEIFNLVKLDNEDCVHFNKFLSANEDIFSDIMTDLLMNDPKIMTTLRAVPSVCTNNPKSDTLQQILHDQTKELISLKNWLSETGLPTHQSIGIENRFLHDQLSNSLDDKQRMNMKLKLVSEMSNKLQADNLLMSRSYSDLNADFRLSLQQNNILKSFKKDTDEEIDKLTAELDTLLKELRQEKQKNKENEIVISNFTKVNHQLKKVNKQLRTKNENQSKKIKKLSNINDQIEIAMEITAAALEQKTQEIEMLKSEHATFENIPSDNINDYGQDFRKNIKLKLGQDPADMNIKSPQSIDRRRSYIFTINDSLAPMANVNMNDIGDIDKSGTASPIFSTRLLSTLSEAETTDVFQFNTPRSRTQSIVSIGGGQKMNVYNSAKNLDFDELKSDCKQLYHDENRGVDMYVFMNKYDPEDIDGDNNMMEEDEAETEDSEEVEMYDEYNENLKELTSRQNSEMIKLKQELEDISKGYEMVFDDKSLLNINNEKKRETHVEKGCLLM